MDRTATVFARLFRYLAHKQADGSFSGRLSLHDLAQWLMTQAHQLDINPVDMDCDQELIHLALAERGRDGDLKYWGQ